MVNWKKNTEAVNIAHSTNFSHTRALSVARLAPTIKIRKPHSVMKKRNRAKGRLATCCLPLMSKTASSVRHKITGTSGTNKYAFKLLSLQSYSRLLLEKQWIRLQKQKDPDVPAQANNPAGITDTLPGSNSGRQIVNATNSTSAGSSYVVCMMVL